MKILVLYILVILSSSASADSVQALIKTRSAKDLVSLRLHERELERSQALCQAQLKRKKLPTSCFRVLAMEEKTGQITLIKKAEGVQWLTDRCSQLAPKIKNTLELKQALEAENLSSRCQDLVRQQLDDLNYVASEDAPDVFFATRVAPNLK
jgi:hypothetical protein